MPSGRFAYGQILRDLSMGVFDFLSEQIVDMSEIVGTRFAFVCGFFDTAVKSGQWPIIGRIQFASPADEWAPPMYVEDVLALGKFQIYHKGKLKNATKEECTGLCRQLMHYPADLVERIEREIERVRPG